MRDELRTEAVYEQARIDRFLWEREKATGLSRRQLLKLMAAGAGAAALGLPGLPRPAGATHVPVVKDTPLDEFYIFPTNRETRWEVMANEGYVTPNHLFFVRNHTSTPHLDATTWRLQVDGTGVSQPIELTYDDLLGMPSESVTKFIECAGNGRSFFDTQQTPPQGQPPASGTPWKLGAIGVAHWRGVPLAHVLELAGLRADAVDVMPEGLDPTVLAGGIDRGHVRRPIPIEKALDDALLVYEMNDDPLPEDHGFPVRLLVPGWVGIANIKWVGQIQVATEPLFSFWNTSQYKLFGPDYPDEPVLTSQEVKSAFELPWNAVLPVGPNRLTGRSWSGHHKIEQVEFSGDGGVSWQLADLDVPNVPCAWVRWEVLWDAPLGPQVLMARATDKRGNVQPLTVPYNTQGYLFWAVVKHPVTVQ